MKTYISPVELPVKATLLYYGMMNLAKVYLSVNKKICKNKNERHGLYAARSHNEVKACPPTDDTFDVFRGFALAINPKLDEFQQTEYEIEDIFKEVIELGNVCERIEDKDGNNTKNGLKYLRVTISLREGKTSNDGKKNYSQSCHIKRRT